MGAFLVGGIELRHKHRLASTSGNSINRHHRGGREQPCSTSQLIEIQARPEDGSGLSPQHWSRIDLMIQHLSCGSYFGQTTKQRELAGLILTETEYTPSAKLPKHSHSQSFFSLVLEGSYVEHFGGGIRECKPSTLLLHPGGEVHSQYCSSVRGRSFHIELSTSWLARVGKFAAILERPVQFRGGPPLWRALRIHNEFRHTDEVSPLAIEGLMLGMLAETTRQEEKPSVCKPPRWLERAREMIHSEFTRGFSLADIADCVGAHPVYLATAFRRFYGSTIGEYVRRLRIDFATKALSTSDTPLVDIALRTGFYDQAHFSRTFKRITGLTPAQFRAKSQAP